MHGPREVVDVLRGDGPPGEHEGLSVADILVHQRLGVKSLLRLARRGPFDKHGGVACVPAGDLEEVTPAVGFLIGSIAVRHVLAIEIGLYRRETIGMEIVYPREELADISGSRPIHLREIVDDIGERDQVALHIGTDMDIRLTRRTEPEVFEKIEVASGGDLHGHDRLAPIEPAFHTGQAFERPASEIVQEVDAEIGALDIGGRRDIERPCLEALGIRSGVVVDIAAQEGDLGQVLPIAGHRPEQRDAVDEGRATDELAGIGVSRVEPLILASCQDQVDGIHRVVDMAAGDLEEIAPAVHGLIALGRVLHVGISGDIRLVPSALVHIHALQSGKKALCYRKW